MPIIYTDKTGIGVNTSRTGVQAATGAGASPILLPDLVAGWALTAGPQQTLDSTGVIASGAYDLTNEGSVTFSASGADFNGTDQGLYRSSSGLDVGTDILFLCFEVTVRSMPEASFRYILAGTRDVGADRWSVSADDQLSMYFYNDTTGLGASYPGGIAQDVRHVVFAWITNVSGGTCTLNIKVDGETTVSANGISTILASDFFNIACAFYTGGVALSLDGVIRRVRAWSSVAVPLAAISWLYNSGDGRTDLEIAEYTG